MCISFSVKNTQKFQKIQNTSPIIYAVSKIYKHLKKKKKTTIEDQRIHQNRKTNNQNRPKTNLIVDEYDGETRSHDKDNELCCR